MNHKALCGLLALFIGGIVLNLSAQGTAFMYQGRLNDSGGPANGAYDLRFALYDAATNGNAISVPQTNFAVAVTGGLFTTNIDFGPVFTGTNYWLSIGVRTNGNTNAFTLLWPRQPLLPVPYAIFATRASNLLGTLSAAQLTGTIVDARLSTNVTLLNGGNQLFSGTNNFTNSANSFFGTFSGNGTNLNNLNASQLTGGTVADARLTTNVALLNRSQIFSNTNSFTNAANSFSGTFNGTFSGNGTNLNNLNASQLTGGTVADARLTTNVALLDHNQTFTGANNFTNAGNSFSGSFFGNGLVGWIPVAGTSVQAVRDTGYLLLNSNLTTVTLPPMNSLFVGDIVRISGPGSGGWKFAQNVNESISGIFLSPSNSSWLPANVGSKAWRAIASSADGVKMVASAVGGGGILVSTDFGRTWNSSSATFSPTCLASSADGTKLFGGIFGGGIIYSLNSGGSWNVSTAPTTNWNGIACSADGSNVVAVVNPGKIYTSADFGVTWTKQNNPPFATWFSVASSADGKKLVAANYGGKIYTSADSGVTWTAQAGSDTTNWTAVVSSADGTKLAAAAFGASPGATLGGRIYTSVDSGVTWTKQTGAPAANWYSLASSFDGGRLAAVANATNGSIYVSGNIGLTWTKQAVDDQNWYSLACSQDMTVMAAVSSDTITSGKIYFWQPSIQGTTTTTGVNGSVTGSPRSAVELQYIGGGSFMLVSSIGVFWAN